MVTKVYYDANFSKGEFRGMGKYINYIDHVLSNEGFHVNPIVRGGETDLGYNSIGLRNYILWEQISVPIFQKRNKGMYIFPYNTAPLFMVDEGNLNVLVVHDLIFMENLGDSKSVRQKIGKAYRRFIVPRIIHRFDHIITVSEYSKSKIINRFNISEDKITVIPNSIELKSLHSDIPRENYIFHLGGEPDYKNTKVLLRGFALLPDEIREKYSLKILGIRDSSVVRSYLKICADLGISNRVEFLGYQTDAEVEDLYKKASLFVFTSIEEGFGIPLIEAMTYKTPLLSSASSCLPEIAGDAAIYFNPYDEQDLATKMQSVLLNPSQMDSRIYQGEMQLKRFSKEVVKQKIIKYFSNL
ncbi:glycosyltransferase family 4 protein [Sphingobacterium multivorum]|uniref:glycosyltransferase family 4 protein n=1 Tax=Sphingobacterium multivorum TaxID=28454 RepID=UPI00289F5E4C|nr:glycosyltransferase family 1 protein [Sphingobacterium multivorum]